ncbi:MAG: flippase [Desulfobaccales bacterium]
MNSSFLSRRRLAAETTAALGVKILSLPLGYILSLLLARFFGDHKFGVYTLAVYLVTILSVFCRFGLDTGMLRFGAGLKAKGRDGEIPRLFWRGLALVGSLSLGVAAGIYLGRGWLAKLLHAPDLTGLLPLMAPALPVMVAAAFCGETLRSLGGARWVVLQQDLLSPLCLLLMVAFLIWRGHYSLTSVEPVAGVYLLSGILGLAFLAKLLAHSFREVPEGRRDTLFRDLCRYSWPLYISLLLLLAFGALDGLVLGFFAGPPEVAYYEAASRTALLVSLPLAAVNAIVPPLFAHLHQEGRLPELETLAQASTRWMYCASLPVALFLMVLAPDILGLFGAGFSDARWGLRILVMAHLVNVACGSVGFLLAMTGEQFTLTAILALAGLCGIPLMALGAAFFGLTGLALAKAFWLVGVNILLSLAVWRRLSLRLFASGVGWAQISGVLSLGLFWFGRPCLGPWVAAGAGALLYFALITRTLYQDFIGMQLPLEWEAEQ